MVEHEGNRNRRKEVDVVRRGRIDDGRRVVKEGGINSLVKLDKFGARRS